MIPLNLCCVTLLRNAFSLFAAGGRCDGVEAELPAVYSFRNSGESGTEWLRSGIGLKAFRKIDCPIDYVISSNSVILGCKM